MEMWTVEKNKILYSPEKMGVFSFQIGWNWAGEKKISLLDIPFEKEYDFVKETFLKKKWIHFCGVRNLETCRFVQKIYDDLGYFFPEKNKYIIPKDAPITLSIDIKNILLSQAEQKKFPKETQSMNYIAHTRERKLYKSFTNMGIIHAWEISPQDFHLLTLVFQEEYTTPLLLGKLLYYNWIDNWLTAQDFTQHDCII